MYGVFISSDAGSSWHHIFPSEHQLPLTFIDVSPTGDLYVGSSYYGPFGLFRSTDYGSSWSRLDVDTMLACSRISVNSFGGFMSATVGGVLTSGDRGETWRLTSLPTGYVQAMASGSPGEILAGATNMVTLVGTYVSTDNGDHWNKIKVGGNYTVQEIHKVNRSIIYTAEQGTFCRSTDAGATWKSVFLGDYHGSVHIVPLDTMGTVLVTNS